MDRLNELNEMDGMPGTLEQTAQLAPPAPTCPYRTNSSPHLAQPVFDPTQSMSHAQQWSHIPGRHPLQPIAPAGNAQQASHRLQQPQQTQQHPNMLNPTHPQWQQRLLYVQETETYRQQQHQQTHSPCSTPEDSSEIPRPHWGELLRQGQEQARRQEDASQAGSRGTLPPQTAVMSRPMLSLSNAPDRSEYRPPGTTHVPEPRIPSPLNGGQYRHSPHELYRPPARIPAVVTGSSGDSHSTETTGDASSGDRATQTERRGQETGTVPPPSLVAPSPAPRSSTSSMPSENTAPAPPWGRFHLPSNVPGTEEIPTVRARDASSSEEELYADTSSTASSELEDELNVIHQGAAATIRERARTQQLFRGSLVSRRVVSKSAMASLQTVAIDSLDPNERTCIICYNDFGTPTPEGINEVPLRLPKCRHIFGDHCIKVWFSESDKCPYCRDVLPSVMQYHTSARALDQMFGTPGVQARRSAGVAPARPNHSTYVRAADTQTRELQGSTTMPRTVESSGSVSSGGSAGSTGSRRSTPNELSESRRRTRPRFAATRPWAPMSDGVSGSRGPSSGAVPRTAPTSQTGMAGVPPVQHRHPWTGMLNQRPGRGMHIRGDRPGYPAAFGGGGPADFAQGNRDSLPYFYTPQAGYTPPARPNLAHAPSLQEGAPRDSMDAYISPGTPPLPPLMHPSMGNNNSVSGGGGPAFAYPFPTPAGILPPAPFLLPSGRVGPERSVFMGSSGYPGPSSPAPASTSASANVPATASTTPSMGWTTEGGSLGFGSMPRISFPRRP